MSSSKSKRLLIINRADLVANLLPANDNSNVSSHQMRTLRLHHSKSKELRPFLVVADQIFELVAYSPELGSVFIDDYVQSECSICLDQSFLSWTFIFTKWHLYVTKGSNRISFLLPTYLVWAAIGTDIVLF